MSTNPQISEAEVWKCIDKICDCDDPEFDFRKSEKVRALLRELVKAALQGSDTGAKQLAEIIYGRRDATQDERNRASLRSRMEDLRRMLRKYYEGPGRSDVIIIELGRSGYNPRIRSAGIESTAAQPSVHSGRLGSLVPGRDEASSGASPGKTPEAKVVRRGIIGYWPHAVAVLGLICASGLYVFRSDNSRLPYAGKLKRITFDDGLSTDAAISPDGGSVVYASNRSPGPVTVDAKPTPLNIWVQALDGDSPPRRLTNDPWDDYDPTFSPDGEEIAYRSDDPGKPGIYTIALNGGASPTFLLRDGRRPRYSPDSRNLLYMRFFVETGLGASRGAPAQRYANAVGLIHLSDGNPVGNPVNLTDGCGPKPAAGVPIWSTDGRYVYFYAHCNDQTGRPQEAIWRSTPSGTRERTTWLDYLRDEAKHKEEGELRSPAVFTRLWTLDQVIDGPPRLIMPFVRGDAGSIGVIRVSKDGLGLTGSVAQLRGTALDARASVADGENAAVGKRGRIALSSVEAALHIWRLRLDKFGHPVGPPEPIGANAGSLMEIDPALSSATGEWLAFVSGQPTKQHVILQNLKTGEVRSITPRGDYKGIVVNRAGTEMAYTTANPPANKGRTIFMTHIPGGEPPRALFHQDPEVYDDVNTLDLSDDGRWLVVLNKRKEKQGKPTPRYEIGIIDLRDGNIHIQDFLKDSDQDLHQAHFSPDGGSVTFMAVPIPGSVSTLDIVPFDRDHPGLVDKKDWTPVTDGTTYDDKPRFSHDGRFIFFVSDRHEHRQCIYAQPVQDRPNPRASGIRKLPVGKPFEIYHFSVQSARSIFNTGYDWLELAAGPNMLVFNQGEFRGNVWLLESTTP